MRINKLLTNGYELTEEEKANLKVTLQDVIGEIQSEEGYWRPFVNGTNGNLYWEWDTSPTGNTPAQRKILYWPAFSADPENSHLLWKLDDDESWTDLNITTSGARGPQGDNGQKGADGTNGTSVRLVSTETVVGGMQVTLGWGTSDTSAFVIPSGAAGTPGTNGVSPAVVLTPIQDQQYPQGGWNVTITDAEHQSGQTFQIFNGIDGQGATVDLVEGNGIQITHQPGTTDYTIGVSANYALKSDVEAASANALSEAESWVENKHYLTAVPSDYATKTYANDASAYALNQAKSWVESEDYLTENDLNGYATETYADAASAEALSQAKTYVNGTSAYLNGSIDSMSSTFNSYSSEMNTWKSGINDWSANINTWQNETVNPKLNELESAIAGIEGASDVYDVVDTSAALNNYTGRLTPKAVIKVLSGGPNNDQQVYYRWKHSKTASGTWTIADFDYIGAVQAYYDKVYIDNNYYKKTETYTKTEVDDYLEGKVDANNKQDFTSAQQLQARTNIGAIGNAEFQQLLDEIELLKNKGLVVVETQLRFV